MDLIYQVFDDLNRAKEEQNSELVKKKEIELDDLRVKLIDSYRSKVSRLSFPKRNQETLKI